MNGASCGWLVLVGTVIASLSVPASYLSGFWANCEETGGQLRKDSQ